MPTLPPLFDLATLDRLLVGLSDGAGGFAGLGYLEHVPEDGGLRLISPVADPPKALRLGSVRLEDDYRSKRVDLRNALRNRVRPEERADRTTDQKGRGRLPSLIKKRRKKMRKKKHKKLLKRTRHQRMKLGK